MVDREKVEQAVRLLLEGIGENPKREGLLETPERIARMYEEICGGMEESAETHLQKTFTAENTEMVVEQGYGFVRVHDVKKNKRAIQMTEAILERA